MTETETSTVTVKAESVNFDDKGRATIADSHANTFIKETLLSEGAIEIGAPDSLRADVNVNCVKCATNLYCPPKAVA